MNGIREQFGDIDIYLFDQLLKGTYSGCTKILDVGCGAGRNIYYFLKEGFNVFGADPDPNAVQIVRELAARLAPGIPAENFVQSYASPAIRIILSEC